MTSAGKIQFIGEWPPSEDIVQSSDAGVSSSTLKQDGVQPSFNDVQIIPTDALLITGLNKQCHVNLQESGCTSVSSYYCIKSEDGETAYSQIAKWWRQQRKQGHCVQVKIPEGCRGKSALVIIARSKEGQDFINSTIMALKCSLGSKPNSPSVCFLLGTYYDLLEDYITARNFFTMAKEQGYKSHELEWYLKKCNKNMFIIKQQEIYLTCPLQLREAATQHFTVERRDCSLLTSEEFFYKYALTSTPVIITGLANEITQKQWTLEYIKELIGESRCPLKVPHSWSREWAKLETVDEDTTVASFISSLSDETKKEKKYLFDWSLPLYAPSLLEGFKIPKYFANDFLQRTEPGTLYQNSWPSLFIAPKGMNGGLHVDAFGSNFWMALFKGEKRWTFFPKEDLPLLYPKYESTMNANFDIDISSPDLGQYPLFANARRTECILKEGEVLFVPHGCPHRVENLELSIAISGNFIDKSNFESSLEALSTDALLDPRAEHLFNQLCSNDFSASMEFFIDHVPWSELPRRVCNKER